MLEAVQSHDEGFDHRATTSHMEAIAILIMSGRFLGYLPTHFAASFVSPGEMPSLLDRKLAYFDTFFLAGRRDERNRATLLLMQFLTDWLIEQPQFNRLESNYITSRIRYLDKWTSSIFADRFRNFHISVNYFDLCHSTLPLPVRPGKFGCVWTGVVIESESPVTSKSRICSVPTQDGCQAAEIATMNFLSPSSRYFPA